MPVSVSARTGRGLDDLLRTAFSIREAWSKRVPTAALNRWFDSALEANPPPAPGGRRIKLRYITQAKTRPPGFVLFGTRLDQLPTSYQRYLVNGILRELGFDAVPIRLTLRTPSSISAAGILRRGEVAERLMATLLKSVESKDFVGSNPTLSAIT